MMKNVHYRPLEKPTVQTTLKKIDNLILELYQGNFIETMAIKVALTNTRSATNTTILQLTKIHKPNSVGRPTISGGEGPTERQSSFDYRLLQPIAKTQKLYLKDTYNRLHQFHREDQSLRTNNYCINGRHEPVHERLE